MTSVEIADPIQPCLWQGGFQCQAEQVRYTQAMYRRAAIRPAVDVGQEALRAGNNDQSQHEPFVAFAMYGRRKCHERRMHSRSARKHSHMRSMPLLQGSLFA